MKSYTELNLDTHTIQITDPEYPQRMRSYQQSPATIYCQGDTSLLNSRCVAIIGTRKPTATGADIAFKLAAFLARAGYTIVSGLALGIDSCAHRGALSVGGRTIAILGSNLVGIYPYQNINLAREIREKKGLLFTQYVTSAYEPKRFVDRDRLQATISLAVMPIQTGILNDKGRPAGTMHTVKSAMEQHRPLIVPLPVPADVQKYPNKYTGIQHIIDHHTEFLATFAGSSQVVQEAMQPIIDSLFVIRGKEDYTALLEYLHALN